MRRAAATLGVVAAFVVVGAGLTGCVPMTTVVEGSEVTVAVSEPFTSLNPWSASGAESRTNADVAWLTGTGFGYRDDRGTLVSDDSFGSAELIEGDRTTARYTVADGVRWSDGTPVDAADLLLSWAAGSGVFEQFDAAPDAALALVTQAPQVTDDRRTLFLHFDVFFSGWETAVAPTLPAHVLAARALGMPIETAEERTAAKSAVVDAVLETDDDAVAAIAQAWGGLYEVASTPDDELLVAAGPYRVVAVADGEVTLAANPEYRGDRVPRVETIQLRHVADPAELGATVAGGDADVAVATASTELLTALEGAKDVTVSVAAGARLEQLQLRLADSRSGAFDDPRIREAFLRTIPRDELVGELLGPVQPDATPLDSFLVAPPSAAYDETVAANGSDDYRQPDPAAARALLAEAGVPAPEVCVLYNADDPQRAQEFELIRDAAAPVGFRVTDCSTSDWRRELARGGAYDAALLAWDLAALGPDAAGALLSSDSTFVNLNRFSDPEADRLIAELAGTDDDARQAELVAELDAVVWSSSAGLPLYAHPVATAVGPGVTGVTASAFGGSVLWNAWTWQPVARAPR